MGATRALNWGYAADTATRATQGIVQSPLLDAMWACVVRDGEVCVDDVEEPSSSLRLHDVLLDVLAVSLQWRDVAVMDGASTSYVPCSDCCARVLAVGDQVTRVKAGQRVCALFFPEWVNHPPV